MYYDIQELLDTIKSLREENELLKINSENKGILRESCESALEGRDARIAQLERQNEKFKEALRKIEKPIAALQKIAEERGEILDGGMAMQLSNSASYLKEIASIALSPDSVNEETKMNGEAH